MFTYLGNKTKKKGFEHLKEINVAQKKLKKKKKKKKNKALVPVPP